MEPQQQQYDPPRSFEHHEAQSHPYPSPPQGQTSAGHHSLRLIWHLCQLCNLTASNISAWLTLEALARETTNHGAFNLPLYNYSPAMGAHAMMMQDMCRNLEETHQALIQTRLHQDCIKTPAYRSLMDAVNGILLIVRVLPHDTTPGPVGGNAKGESMPSPGEVEQVRQALDEITVLCKGDSARGIVGWTECFDSVKALMWR